MSRSPEHDKRCDNAEGFDDLCQPCFDAYQKWLWEELADE